MSTLIAVDIGGKGEQVDIQIIVHGCECRAEDFIMELVRFANNFKNKADARQPVLTEAKPCGCKDS